MCSSEGLWGEYEVNMGDASRAVAILGWAWVRGKRTPDIARLQYDAGESGVDKRRRETRERLQKEFTEPLAVRGALHAQEN